MTTQHDKAQRFRSLHERGSPLVLFNVWDAGSARAVAAAGAEALATGSWSVAAANGYADGEQVPLELALGNLQRIAQALELPVSVDLESGYGRDPDAVGATIARAIAAGAVGCNLEDSDPEGGELRDPGEQALRLAAARAAADAAGIPFFVNARTDVFLRTPPEQHGEVLASALERARIYAEHGADGLFVPGLVDPALIGRVVEAVTLPVNVMVVKATPPLAELAALGVARASHGPGPYAALMRSLEEAARQAMA